MTLLDKTRRALALIPAVIAAAAPVAAQDAPASGWRSIRLHENAGEQDGLLRTVRPIGAIAPWVSATDFPADLPTGKGSGYVRLRISIDTADRITGCEVTASDLAPHLGNWACERIRLHGKFRHALSLDGKPVDSVVMMTMVFELASAPLPMMPPAPPPPPYGWVETYRSDLKLADLPESAMRGAATLTGSAVLNMSLWQKSDGTFAKPDCRTVRSSGNSEIDKASCSLLESASYSFIAPGRRYGSMQIRVHWKKGRARSTIPIATGSRRSSSAWNPALRHLPGFPSARTAVSPSPSAPAGASIVGCSTQRAAMRSM